MFNFLKKIIGINHRYLFFYDYLVDNKYGKGHVEVILYEKIKNADQILKIQSKIKEKNDYDWVLINNFIKLN